MGVDMLKKMDDIDDLASQLQTALTRMLSKTLRIDAQDIDVRCPLRRYGLDSIDAVILADDLEEWLNIELPSTLLWDYPTVSAIAGFIEAQLGTMPQECARLALEHRAPSAQRLDAGDPLDRLDDKQIDALLIHLIP